MKRGRRGPSPSPEELEFIFEHLERLSDSEVVVELQGTEFPPRGRRFIQEKRRYWNAARKVLEEKLKAEIDPALAQRRKEHWDELTQEIERLRDALCLPDFGKIISNRRCPLAQVDESLEGHGWTLEHTSEPGQCIISLCIEKFDPLLFNAATSHLQAEFPEYEELLLIWKRKAGILVNRYLNLVDEIGKVAEEQTHMPIIHGYDERGLRSALAFQVFYWVLTNFRCKGHYMPCQTRGFLGGKAELSSLIKAEQGYYQKVLASGSAEEIAKCEDPLRGLVDCYIEDERVGKIVDNISEVPETLKSLTSIFSLVIHRKTFVGSCPICAPWA